jgi:Holliday junction resolvasome RuvABC endonuclease subunit
MNENYTILSIDIGKKNLGYSIYNGIELNFGIFDITYHIKKFKLNENIEGRNTVLIKWLGNMLHKYYINKIVVEKQVINNVVAMCIQSCIISFALMNSIEIFTFDPKNKFTFSGDKYISSKKEHKKLTVKYVINLLTELHNDKLELFNQYDKQDDISDSILMNFMTHPNTNLKKLRSIILCDKNQISE